MPQTCRRRIRNALRLAALALPGLVAAVAAQHVPSRLSDAEFWKLVTDFSESTGTFPSENFASNELGYQYVIPELLRTIKPGGAYIGVGPEQNFTYIAALHPSIAFIVDIRRQAVVQHLLYKAVFELSKDRADFLSLLFARHRPSGLDETAGPAALFAAYDTIPLDTAMSQQNLRRIIGHLTQDHGFTLSNEDRDTIRHLYDIICRDATHLTYNSGNGAIASIAWQSSPLAAPETRTLISLRPGANGRVDTVRMLVRTFPNGQADTAVLNQSVLTVRGTHPAGAPPIDTTTAINAMQTGVTIVTSYSGTMILRSSGGRPDYHALMTATDREGVERSYLANEANFRAVRDLEIRNLVVPVVGDVSGPKALRAVGQYLQDHHATVTAYYVSNVEQYLFQNGVWDKFYATVGTLPIDSTSVFIRSQQWTEIGSIRDLLAAVATGQIRLWADLRPYSHQ